MRILFILLFFSLLCAPFARTQDTLVFDGVKDTYINTVIADQYQGQVQSIIAAGWTYGGVYGQGRSLLGFEICELPDNFTLVNATLHLFHDYSSGHAGHTTGNNSAKVYKITSAWDESTTWGTQPTYDPQVFAVIPATTTSNDNVSIDVTGMVNNMIASTTEIDFYFKLDNEEIYRSLVFGSTDHPDMAVRPKLELVFLTDTTWCGVTPEPTDTTTVSDTTAVPGDTITVPGSSVTIDPSCTGISVPNVFSPNGDKVNDLYFVKTECNLVSFHISILNRWGEPVFLSDDVHFTWNGEVLDTGLPAKEGSYFYKVLYNDGNSLKEKHGFITLVR